MTACCAGILGPIKRRVPWRYFDRLLVVCSPRRLPYGAAALQHDPAVRRHAGALPEPGAGLPTALHGAGREELLMLIMLMLVLMLMLLMMMMVTIRPNQAPECLETINYCLHSCMLLPTRPCTHRTAAAVAHPLSISVIIWSPKTHQNTGNQRECDDKIVEKVVPQSLNG